VAVGRRIRRTDACLSARLTESPCEVDAPFIAFRRRLEIELFERGPIENDDPSLLRVARASLSIRLPYRRFSRNAAVAARIRAGALSRVVGEPAAPRSSVERSSCIEPWRNSLGSPRSGRGRVGSGFISQTVVRKRRSEEAATTSLRPWKSHRRRHPACERPTRPDCGYAHERYN